MALWSEKAYGDFELVCDWRFAKSGEWAVYLRGTKREVALKSGKSRGLESLDPAGKG